MEILGEGRDAWNDEPDPYRDTKGKHAGDDTRVIHCISARGPLAEDLALDYAVAEKFFRITTIAKIIHAADAVYIRSTRLPL